MATRGGELVPVLHHSYRQQVGNGYGPHINGKGYAAIRASGFLGEHDMDFGEGPVTGVGVATHVRKPSAHTL